MEGKKINVYYKGVKQKLRVFDNTSESELLDFIIKVFHLKADKSKIFLQDDEGNFLLFPKIIPDGLNIHLYIEPEFIPNPSNVQNTQNNISYNGLLPGFKWDANFSCYDGPPKVSADGYVLGKLGQGTGWTPVVSTIIYTYGKLFCKMNAFFAYYQALGVCNLKYDGKKLHWNNDNIVAFNIHDFYHDFLGDNFTHSVAFLLNMNNKTFSFYDLKNDKYVKKLCLSFPFDKVRIFAWVKSYGFSILEGGSSPIPSYLQND